MSGDVNTGFIEEEYRASNSEEVLPHKEIALASAAIAALHREQEQTLGLSSPRTPPNRRSGANRASAIRCAATKVSQAAAGAARKA